MKSLIDNARTFRDRTATERDHYRRLAEGQRPQALFITCSDSRIVPALITGSRPGDLFELRTAGNIVPPYLPGRPAGETATIEYAVEVLGVRDLILCGHSHCGAVGALVNGDDLTSVPAVREWLGHAAPEDLATEETVATAVRRNVLAQLGRLRRYPCVRDRLPAGRLRLHGWFYEIDTGVVLAHDPRTDRFLPL